MSRGWPRQHIPPEDVGVPVDEKKSGKYKTTVKAKQTSAEGDVPFKVWTVRAKERVDVGPWKREGGGSESHETPYRAQPNRAAARPKRSREGALRLRRAARSAGKAVETLSGGELRRRPAARGPREAVEMLNGGEW